MSSVFLLQVFLLLASPVNLHVILRPTSSSLPALFPPSTTAGPLFPPVRSFGQSDDFDFNETFFDQSDDFDPSDTFFGQSDDLTKDFDRVKCDACEFSCRLHGIENVRTFCNECRKSVGCSELPKKPILKEVLPPSDSEEAERPGYRSVLGTETPRYFLHMG